MNTSLLGRIWKWARWPLVVVILAYAILVGFRTKYLFDQDATAEAVAKIHNTRLTKEELFGYMPPAPDPVENNKTLSGIDSNKNGIRDDVEIAIYNAHKDSAKETAAAFQYAKALQVMLTQVYNTETWIAAAEEVSRASGCVSMAVPNKSFELYQSRIDEVESLLVNTTMREKALDQAYSFTTSYSLPNQDLCNIDLNSLPN